MLHDVAFAVANEDERRRGSDEPNASRGEGARSILALTEPGASGTVAERDALTSSWASRWEAFGEEGAQRRFAA